MKKKNQIHDITFVFKINVRLQDYMALTFHKQIHRHVLSILDPYKICLHNSVFC